MATVWIPSLLRPLSEGLTTVEVPGRSLREVFAALDARFPGIGARLMEDGDLRPEIAVAVDGETTEIGLYQPVDERSEVHILPAIGGG